MHYGASVSEERLSQCLTCAAGYQRAAVDAPLSHV